MKTGFWNTVNTMKPVFTLEYERIDTTTILKRSSINTDSEDTKYFEQFTANDFLHGFCSIFALCLHKKFGYEIYRVYDEEEAEFYFEDSEDIYSGSFPFIHDFVKSQPNKLIDIRGIIDIEKSFMTEFEDFFSDDYTVVHLEDVTKYESELKKYYHDYVGEKSYDLLTEIANSWINNHLEYYAEK